MFKKSILAMTLMAAAATAAQAQGTDTAPGPTPAPTTGASGDVFQKGTLGVSLPFTLLSNIAGSIVVASEPVPTIDLLYFLDNKTALDLVAGLNLHKEQVTNAATPPMTTDTTVFGFAVGAGYRMYKHMDKLHTFLEPQVVLTWGDTSNSAAFSARASFVFGVERMLADWMSLSGAIGGGVVASNKFNDIQLATSANLAANLYWK